MEPIIYFIILEDDTDTQQLVLSYFKEFTNFKCKGCFTKAMVARDFLLENPVHLLIADIQLPDMNGMEMIESLPNKPLIVFMTGHNSKKTATKGYAFDAVHYLTKPFSFKDFNEAMNRVVDRVNGKPKTDNSLGDYILFGKGTKERILLGEIRYIEVNGNDLTIHLSNEDRVTFRETLKEVLDKLPKTYFIQIHRSYIINTWHLRKLGKNFITLYGTDTEIPVSRTYRSDLKKRIPEEVARSMYPTA